jgi:hypothetical protein
VGGVGVRGAGVGGVGEVTGAESGSAEGGGAGVAVEVTVLGIAASSAARGASAGKLVFVR